MSRLVPPPATAGPLPPEIGFLVGRGFDPTSLARAAALARACGSDAATALLHAGLIDEAAYYRALAEALGVPFLDGDLPLGEGTRFPDSLVAGIAPLARPGPAAFVCAPRGPAIAALLREGTAMAMTTPGALRAAVFAANPAGIAAHAAETLQRQRPDWALGPGVQGPHLAILGLVLGAGGLAAGLAPAALLLGAWTLVQLVFLATVTFRIAAVSVEAEPAPAAALSDRDLPVYTVLVALHREARVVPRLVIDNLADGRLTRCFAIEYAALFDVLVPALASWRLPIPLGGTTTHFRTAVLRAVHGWDAFNVTEDADLGIRLARAGYHVGDLASDTLEEAPRRFRPWLRQRTRWMKGFLQTSLTHARAPRTTIRQLGPLGTLCALALVPGTVVSALLYPFLMGRAAYDFALFVASGFPAHGGFWASLPAGSAITLFVAGLLAMLLPGALGCVRRGWFDCLIYVPLMPAYFLLVSLAAWCGLVELIRAPNRWNKTEHGLSRTSRSGAMRVR